MDWMYKADKPDTEEYLLGRRIDKHIEEQDKPEENKGTGKYDNIVLVFIAAIPWYDLGKVVD